MAFENKQYWTEARLAAFKRTEEARMQGLKKAQQNTSGPASPKKRAALDRLYEKRRGTTLPDELKQKDREAMLKKYAEDPDFYAQVVENNRRINSDPETRRKLSESMQQRWEDVEYVERHREAMNRPEVHDKLVKNQTGRVHTEEHNQKISVGTSRGQKARWAKATKDERTKHIAPALRASQLANPSSLEIQIKGLLDVLGIEYVEQYQIGNAIHTDFYIPSHNLVLEIYGCYWHGCNLCGYNYADKIKSDRKREYFIRSQGYNLYMLWEHDMGRSEEILTKLLH